MPRPAVRLRATRANPPGLVSGDDERRALYSAALQQSEDLFAAAASVGPLARPLPLFYAVSQAGRALVASRKEEKWQVRGHGLTQEKREPAWSYEGGVLHFGVEPKPGGGLFGATAAALGVRGLTGACDIGALWAALPEAGFPGIETWARALRVWPPIYDREKYAHLRSYHSGYVILPSGFSAEREAIDKLLMRYPDADGAHVVVSQTIIPTEETPFGFGVLVKWPEPPNEPGEQPSKEFLDSRVHVRVPEVRPREHWLVPSVGNGDDGLPLLLLWWALLFGLSLLARYEPVAWQAALNPDASELAVPLEELLDNALEIVPDLFVDALSP
jgi:hypothetical protein